MAGRPPLPASTQATCATSCRRGVSTSPNSNRAAAAAAVAALLPRGSRSAPASTGAGPTASRRRGDNATPAEGMWLRNGTSGDPRSPSSLFPNRCSLMERDKSEKEQRRGSKQLGPLWLPPAVCGVVGPGPPLLAALRVCICMCTVCKRRGGRKRLLWTGFGGGYTGLQALGCVLERIWQPKLHVLASFPRVERFLMLHLRGLHHPKKNCTKTHR